MRGIEAGDLRGHRGIALTQLGVADRSALARPDDGGLDRTLDRARAFETFAGAVLGALRGGAPGTLAAAPGLRSSVESIGVALRDALASGESVDALLSKVDAALLGAAREVGLSEAAADRLARAFRSALADGVEALAHRLADDATAAAAPSLPAAAATTPARSPAPATTPAHSGDAATSAAPTASIASASYRVVQKTGIELLTQEGDVVRISLRTKEGFRASGGYSPTGAYLDVAAYSKSRFTVEVRGALSATERAAIDDVLGQVDAIAKDFYAGETAAAFAAGAALDVDAEQLAAVSLRMSQSTSLRVASRAEWAGGALVSVPITTPRPMPLQQAVPLPAPAPQPAATTKEGTAGAPLEPAASSGDDRAGATSTVRWPTPTSAQPQSPARGPAPAPAQAPASAAPITRAAAEGTARTAAPSTMTDYLVRLLDQLGASTVAGRVEFSARAKLQLVVAAVDGARLPGAAPEADAARLLAQVVGATTDRSVA